MANLTLLDVAKRTGVDSFYEDVLTQAPELTVLPLVQKPGTSYRVLRRTGLPAGGFRDANYGAAETKSTYEHVLREMYFWDCPMFVDEAIVSADTGEAGDLLMQEASGAVRDNIIKIGTQIYTGRSADAKGFIGLFDSVASGMVVDAQGTGTTDTVWFVYANGDDPAGVKIPFKSDNGLTPKPWMRSERVVTGGTINGYATNLSWWLGLDIGNAYSIGCIKNITAAKPVTDALGEKLRSLFKVGRKPTHAFMSPTSRYLLQASRTAIGNQKSNSRGDAFSPLPEYLGGAMIVETDSIGTIAAW